MMLLVTKILLLTNSACNRARSPCIAELAGGVCEKDRFKEVLSRFAVVGYTLSLKSGASQPCDATIQERGQTRH